MAATSRSSSSTDPVALLEVGRIDKPHGIRGDVVVALTTTESSRVDPGMTLTTPAGERLRIVASRPHQHRWIVTFDGVEGRSAAEALAGTRLLAEPLDDDPDALWVHELIGSSVVEVDGTARGAVVAVQDNPASDLLVLDTGALVPLRFVTGRDADGRIVVDVPEGLFDLFDLVDGE